MKKAIKGIYGIAGGLALAAAVLLLFLFWPGGKLSGEQMTVGGEEEQELLAQQEPKVPDMGETENEVSAEPAEDVDDGELTEELKEAETADEAGKAASDEVIPEEPILDEEPAVTGFTMTFAGDTYYNERRVNQYQNNGVKGLLDDTLLQLICEADVSVLNNECALSDGGTAMEDKEYTYRMTPSLTQSYVDMGIDLVTLANNHALDFGTEALTDTFETLDAYGIDYIGAGSGYDRAKQAAVYEVGGQTVAVLAASRVIPVVEWNIVNRQPGMFCTYDSTALEEEIRACAQEYDHVVVYVHWGVMETPQPVDYQREMAYRYIDAGADAVIGTHPHVVQSIEFYQEKPIYYSLGNFLYGSTIGQTMLLALEVDEEGDLASRIYPCYAEGGTTHLMDTEKGQEFYRYMESISYSVQIDEQGYVKESEDGRSE